MTARLGGKAVGDTMVLQIPGLEPELPLLEWCQSMGLPEGAETYFSDVTLRHADPTSEASQFASQCCVVCVVGGDGEPAGSRWAALRRFVETAKEVYTLARYAPDGASDRARAARLGAACAALLRRGTSWPTLEAGDPAELAAAHAWARETFERVEDDLEQRLRSGCVFEWLGLTGELGWLVSPLGAGPSFSLAEASNQSSLAIRMSCISVASYDKLTLLAAPLPALEHTRAMGEEVLPVVDVEPEVLELALQLRAQGDGATFSELVEAVVNARS